MNRTLCALAAAIFAAAALALPQAADARGHHDITKVFSDVYVAPHDVVDGDVTVVFGNATIAGTVHGDVNTMFGSCITTETAVIDGDRNCVQGDAVRSIVPWVIPHRFGGAVLGETDRALFQKLASSAIVLLIFLLFPLRMRIALDRVERHPALSVLTGTIAAVLALPIGIVLMVTLIGIPLALLEVLAILLGVWIGTGAIALVLGRRLCELVVPAATPSPFVALIIGLVVVSAAEIAPFVGWAVTSLVWLGGIGCAILAFVRSSYLDGALGRPSIGGPPAHRGWR